MLLWPFSKLSVASYCEYFVKSQHDQFVKSVAFVIIQHRVQWLCFTQTQPDIIKSKSTVVFYREKSIHALRCLIIQVTTFYMKMTRLYCVGWFPFLFSCMYKKETIATIEYPSFTWNGARFGFYKIWLLDLIQDQIAWKSEFNSFRMSSVKI